MKKSILLIVLMLATFSVFSQNVTNNPIVVLDSITAKRVVSELILYDACQEENAVLQTMVTSFESKSLAQSAMIKNLENQKQMLTSAVDNTKMIIANDKIIIKNLENEISSKKPTGFLWKVLAIAGVVGTGYFAIR